MTTAVRFDGTSEASGADRHVYERHRPEETPLYRIVPGSNLTGVIGARERRTLPVVGPRAG